jgi:hypothetical protein
VGATGAWPRATAVSVWETGSGEPRPERRAGEVRDQAAGRLGCRGPGGEPRRVGRGLLERRGQGADERDSLDGQDLADLVEDELGLAPDDRVGRRPTGPEEGLVADRIGDSQPPEHIGEVDPARPAVRRIDVDEGGHPEQRVAEGLGGGNVRQRRAAPDTHAHGRAREVDAGPRTDEPLAHEVFDGSVGQHEHVGWLAGDGPLRERADGAGRQRDRVAGLAVEGLGQLADDASHRARAQHSERHRHVVFPVCWPSAPSGGANVAQL